MPPIRIFCTSSRSISPTFSLQDVPPRETGTHGLPATGPYMVASVPPRPPHQARSQPVLPRVVEGRTTGRIPGRDRRPDRGYTRRGGRRGDSREGGRLQHRSIRESAVRGQDGRAHDPACESGAHEPTGGDDRALPQYAASALQQSRRTQGAELRGRSRSSRHGARRPGGGPDDLPNPASALSRLPPLLPVQRGHLAGVDGARPRKGPRARGSLGHARHEDPVLVLGRPGRSRSVRRSSCCGRSATASR